MLVTSATTCTAFLCCFTSPISEPQNFGLFAALVILMDYVLVMTMFCTAVTVYHYRFEDTGNKNCCKCMCNDNCACPDRGYAQKLTPTQIAHQKNVAASGSRKAEQDRITTWYSTTFTDFILSKRNRVGIAVVLLSWLGVAAYFASTLEPIKETEPFLQDDHPLQKSITLLNTKFPTATDDRGLDVYFVFGIDSVDREGVNLMFNDTYIGEVKYTPGWSLTPACQTHLQTWCDNLEQTSSYTPYIKRKMGGLGDVACWISDFKLHTETVGTYAYPVTATNLKLAMEDFAANGVDEEGEEIFMAYENEIGWNGKELKYAAISVQAEQLNPWATYPEDVFRKEYDWFLAKAAEMDGACGPAIMTDLRQKFVFMNNQRIYRESAIIGAVLGVAIAFSVILIATGYPLLALFATLSILATLVGVVGALTMGGMELGTTEAVLISILAGFSVDYVVHLGHAYVQNREAPNNDERVRAAFAEMGVSVFSGMLTSIVASIPLFFCNITFFAKFGSFLCLTIGLSWINANFGFMSLVATFGHGPALWKASHSGAGSVEFQ
jgi:hypothetical protein